MASPEWQEGADRERLLIKSERHRRSRGSSKARIDFCTLPQDTWRTLSAFSFDSHHDTRKERKKGRGTSDTHTDTYTQTQIDTL